MAKFRVTTHLKKPGQKGKCKINVVTLDQMIVDGHKTRLTSTKVKYRASHERKYNVACPNLESEQSSSFEKNPKGHPQIKAFQSFGALFELI